MLSNDAIALISQPDAIFNNNIETIVRNVIELPNVSITTPTSSSKKKNRLKKRKQMLDSDSESEDNNESNVSITSLLTNNYVGLPSMINLLGKWRVLLDNYNDKKYSRASTKRHKSNSNDIKSQVNNLIDQYIQYSTFQHFDHANEKGNKQFEEIKSLITILIQGKDSKASFIVFYLTYCCNVYL